MEPLKITDIGIDYLSFTVKHDSPNLKPIRAYFDRLMEAEIMQGHKQREIAPSGFRGAHVGHFFYGSGKHGTLFQSSGAPTILVAREMRQYGNAIKATRIDFQITYKGEEEPGAFASGLRDKVKEATGGESGKKPVSTTLYETGGGGDSVSFGSRRSRKSLISYDKSAEQRGRIEPGLIRDEARFFKEQARVLWQDFCDQSDDEQFIVGVLVAYWANLGVKRSYSITAPEYRLPSSYTPSDEERKVRWLCELVAPAVRSIKNPVSRMRVANAFGHAVSPESDAFSQSRRLEARDALRAIEAQRKIL